MSGDRIGAGLGEAAVHAEQGYQALVRMAVRLDLAGLDVTEEVGEVIEAVADLSAALVQLADDYGSGAAA